MTAALVSHEALRDIRLLLLDVDGVLTDGGLWYGPDGGVTKRFSAQDGLGVSRLLRAGITVGVVTGRHDPAIDQRMIDLGIDLVRADVADKAAVVDDILREREVAPERTAFVGDDIIDLPAMARVGASIAVANAHPAVIEAARLVTTRRGGDGAVREVADAILGDLDFDPAEVRQ